MTTEELAHELKTRRARAKANRDMSLVTHLFAVEFAGHLGSRQKILDVLQMAGSSKMEADMQKFVKAAPYLRLVKKP